MMTNIVMIYSFEGRVAKKMLGKFNMDMIFIKSFLIAYFPIVKTIKPQKRKIIVLLLYSWHKDWWARWLGIMLLQWSCDGSLVYLPADFVELCLSTKSFRSYFLVVHELFFHFFAYIYPFQELPKFAPFAPFQEHFCQICAKTHNFKNC